MDKLIAFDCDGTLVDSRVGILRGMREAFQKNGLIPPSESRILGIVGLKLHEAIYRLCDFDDIELVNKLERDFVDIFKEGINQGGYIDEVIIDGVNEVLDELSSIHNYKKAIITGKCRRALKETMNHFDFHNHFNLTKTADCGPGKPNPKILIDAMIEMGVKSEDTIMVGDTIYDIEMGNEIGVHTIGVTFGYHSREDLVSAGADYIIDDMREILPIVDNIFNQKK